jgi:hypothetical protein
MPWLTLEECIRAAALPSTQSYVDTAAAALMPRLSARAWLSFGFMRPAAARDLRSEGGAFGGRL